MRTPLRTHAHRARPTPRLLCGLAAGLQGLGACGASDATQGGGGTPDAARAGDAILLVAPATNDAGTDDASSQCEGASSIVCSSACVDPTQPSHCGSCTNVCPPPVSGNGVATCTPPMMCGVACDSGYHLCNGDCLSDSDVPSNASDPCVLTAAQGVFVSPTGSDTNPGTMALPYKTLGHAMDVAELGAKRVYACGNASYGESLTIGASRDGLKVYGGLDCSNPAAWVYSASNPATLAPLSGYALTVTGLATGVTFEDFAFDAPPGVQSGASSIGIFVNASTGVVLRRCSVQAGPGQAGQDETQAAAFSSAAPAGSPGTTVGGAAMPNPVCGVGTGGAGGDPGNAGSDGLPLGAPNHGTLAGCGNAIGGGSGAAGSDGLGGTPATAWATFDASGWTPSAGQLGAVGSGGQGGGGGAARDASGGGGGGGAGGCAGAGGAGGPGGGSSIAVLLLNSTFDLEVSTLVASSAGRGGNGAPGQTGQAGGGPGSAPSGSMACAGGAGGAGGNGGQGGGGAGGLSAGVVWLGTAPTFDGVTMQTASTLSNVTIGTPGAGGAGAPGTEGKAGVALPIVAFPAMKTH